jgi:hypothetical protein
MVEPNGELLCHTADETNNGSYWYEWIGGRIILTTFPKLLYDLPGVEMKLPVNVGDIIQIGPYRLRMLGFEEDRENVLFIRQRGVYISPKLTALIRDKLSFIAVQLGHRLQRWGTR